MDFDEHDEGEGDEEMVASMPVSSSYEVPLHPAEQLGGAGVAKPAGDSGGGGGGGGRFRIQGGSAGGTYGGVRYRECLKNHAVGIGGHALDGCGEFMAAAEEGSIDALRCAACGCHRNFHRKESDDSPNGAVSPSAITAAYGALPPHHQFSPYYRTPAGYLQHQQQHQMATAAAVAAAGHTQQRPLALPSTSHSGRDEADDMSGMLSPMVMGSMMAGMSFGSAGPSGSGSGSGKKRFRTRFSQEQKEKMHAFAERLGWRIQKHDEAAVQQFCEEVCLRRHVLKVWMHNNKHTLGKKP